MALWIVSGAAPDGIIAGLVAGDRVGRGGCPQRPVGRGEPRPAYPEAFLGKGAAPS